MAKSERLTKKKPGAQANCFVIYDQGNIGARQFGTREFA